MKEKDFPTMFQPFPPEIFHENVHEVYRMGSRGVRKEEKRYIQNAKEHQGMNSVQFPKQLYKWLQRIFFLSPFPEDLARSVRTGLSTNWTRQMHSARDNSRCRRSRLAVVTHCTSLGFPEYFVALAFEIGISTAAKKKERSTLQNLIIVSRQSTGCRGPEDTSPNVKTGAGIGTAVYLLARQTIEKPRVIDTGTNAQRSVMKSL
jgi:hypothetical protein